MRRSARELLTKNELQNIIHRQGFASIDDVQSCILETGGSFSIEGKKPRRTAVEHEEILERMESLARQIDDLKSLLRPREDGLPGPLGSLPG